MTYYQKHIFFCCNEKAAGKKCCATAEPELMAQHATLLLKAEDQWGEGKIRVSRSACLGRCASGPCLVVYPQGDWYTYRDSSDIDTIINAILTGETADGLRMDDKNRKID